MLVIMQHVSPYPWLLRCGWIGVDLFFVLSGFLVGGLLFAEYRRYSTIDVLRFYIRRGFKIYPAFYLFLVLSLLMQYQIDPPRAWSFVAAEILFLQNYFRPVWTHTWSLAVEEHFYLLLPLLLLLMLRRRSTGSPFATLPHIVISVAGITLGLRVINTLVRSAHTFGTHHFPTHLRLDALLCGVLLAYWYHFHWAALLAFCTRWRTPLVAAVPLLIIPCTLYWPDHRFVHTIGFTLLTLGFSSLVLTVLGRSRPAPRNPLWQLLSHLGIYSYSIYLWHYPVIGWLRLYCPSVLTSGWPGALWLGALSVIPGVLMAKLVEYPLLRLRDVWFPTRSRLL